MKKLFSELVDIPQLQGLLDSLYAVTGVASNIVDNDLTILAKTGWTDICLKFHRAHPETEAKCHKSAKKIFDNLHNESYIAYKCLNGLYDCACPIVVNGESIAILFVAQFMLEPPDVELFRSQARYYGFDENAYIGALHKVPVITEEKLVKIIRLYSDLASILADMGLRRLKQQEAFEALQKRESALRESEEKYRSLVNNINVGIYRSTANPEDGFIQANPALVKILGYDSLEEFMKTPVNTHYQDATDRERLVADATRNGFIKNRKLSFSKKDGTPIWCSLSTTVHYDINGNIEWMDGIVEDVTDRKKAEDALKQAHDELELKVEQRTQELASANQELTAMNEEHTAMNEELTAMNEELLNTNTELYNEVTQRQRVEQELTKAIDELKSMQVHLVQSLTTIYTSNQRLKHSYERYERLFNSSSDAIFVYNLDGNGNPCPFVEVNEAACQMFGLTKETLSSLTICDIVDPKYQQELLADIQQMLSKNHMLHQMSYKTSQETVVDVEINSRIFELDGTKSVLSIARNITEKKRLEAEMQRLSNMHLVGEMAAGIGHELRNPMTTVRGFLQFLQNSEPREKVCEYYRVMIEELDRANSIITEYLNLAKNKTITLTKVNLNDMIKTLLPLIQSDAILSNHSVEMNLSHIPNLVVDEKEIRQLILNLCRNGLDAMDSGGNLTIKTYMDGELIVLAIADIGHGIPDILHDKIGTPFFTTKDQGVGLGLAICYSIAARNFATIDFSSDSYGTIFQVKFRNDQLGAAKFGKAAGMALPQGTVE